MKSGSDLQRDVLDELAFKPMAGHAHIGFAAKSFVVTLAGCVPNCTQKFAAERSAARASGDVLGWNERTVAQGAPCSIPGLTRVVDGIVFA